MGSNVSALTPKRCFFLSCWTLSTAQLRMDVTSGVVTLLRGALTLCVDAEDPACLGPEDCLLGVKD